MNVMTLVRPLAALLIATAPLAAPAADGERAPLRRGSPTAAAEAEARVIVKLKADSTLMRALAVQSNAADVHPQAARTLSQRLGFPLSDGHAIAPRVQVVKASGVSSADLAARLGALSDVEYAVVDGRMRALAAPNDPLYANGQAGTPVVGQWYLRAPTSSTITSTTSIVSAINAEAAWDITTGRSSVIVAVLDTGVRPDHPDLAGKLVAGYDFIADAATAADGQSTSPTNNRDSDPSDPGDFVTQADVNGGVSGCSPSDIDNSSWHGTQTAGLVGAATNNGIGIASVGRDVRVLPVRVLGKCGGFDSDIVAAMRWAGGLAVADVPINPTPAKVVNLSLGSNAACSAAYQDVINQLNAAGVVVTAAAGNSGIAVGSPANCNGVIAVAGVRHAGTKVGYSDLGPNVTISAPAGNCVTTTGTCQFPLVTTSNIGTTTPAGSTYTTGGSNATLGTSFSAPLVAGSAALMFSVSQTLTPAQLTAALRRAARAFPTSGAASGVVACTAPSNVVQDVECYCTTSTCGAGLLDAGAAVAAVATIHANIDVSANSVVAGTQIRLDGSTSWPSPNRTIVGYQWAITSGGSSASISSATNTPTATLATTGSGPVTVSLTVTDSGGVTDTRSAALDVTPAPPSDSGGGGGGGGGALGIEWLASLGSAVLALAAASFLTSRRPRSPFRARRP